MPSAALSAQGGWRAVHREYLFPVRALSRYFRGHFVRSLRTRYRHDELSRVEDPEHLTALLDTLMAQEWVVHSKPWLAHTEVVVAYLAHYTQRIALSEHRLFDFRDGEVALDYKDYRDQGRHKIMALSGEELIRHVLPKGFMRIDTVASSPTVARPGSWRRSERPSGRPKRRPKRRVQSEAL